MVAGMVWWWCFGGVVIVLALGLVFALGGLIGDIREYDDDEE